MGEVLGVVNNCIFLCPAKIVSEETERNSRNIGKSEFPVDEAEF